MPQNVIVDGYRLVFLKISNFNWPGLGRDGRKTENGNGNGNQKCLPAGTEMSSNQSRHVFQPKQKCLLAKTETSSSQDTRVF